VTTDHAADATPGNGGDTTFGADPKTAVVAHGGHAAGQHIVGLDGDSADVTHPAGCQVPDACTFTTAAAAVPPVMLATGGTWTCDLNNGSLILLKRIAIPT
jgi:hypothetical protein